MKKKNFSLEKKLAAYSAMGVAFLAANPQVAKAGVVYHDPDPDPTTTAIGTYNTIYLDIDGNASAASYFAGADFYLFASNTVGLWVGAGVYYAGTSMNQVATSYNTVQSTHQARNFGSGATIGPAASFSSDEFMVAYASTNTDETAWAPSPATGFVGVRFEIGGNTHYGWIRARVEYDRATLASTTLTILDYAYDDTPDTPIAAGAGIPAPATVPTLGEWGLITLGLFLMSFGTVVLAKQEGVLGTATAGSTRSVGLKWLFSNPPFYLKEFKKALLFTGALAAILGVASIITTGGITAVDFFGTMVAGPLFAYLMHLLVVFEKESAARRNGGE